MTNVSESAERPLSSAVASRYDRPKFGLRQRCRAVVDASPMLAMDTGFTLYDRRTCAAARATDLSCIQASPSRTEPRPKTNPDPEPEPPRLSRAPRL